jgi:hypothetical protein
LQLGLGLQYKLEQYDIGRQRHWVVDNALSLASQKQLMSVGQQRHRVAKTVMSLAGKQFVMSRGGSIIGWQTNC